MAVKRRHTVSTIPEENFWKEVFSFLNTNEIRFINHVSLAGCSSQELLPLDNSVVLAQSLNDIVLGSKGDTEKVLKKKFVSNFTD